MPATLPLAPHPATVETPRSETHDIDAILSHSETSKREKIMAINRLAIPGPLKMAGIRAATSGVKALAPRPPVPPPGPVSAKEAGRFARAHRVDGRLRAGSGRRRRDRRGRRTTTMLIAARTRVDFLVKTDDARAELEKALAACSDDASALGDAAARAVAGGLDPEEPLVASCRRRLSRLLARDDDPPG